MSICLESVSMVSMGESIINDVSLTVERGSMNVLLGPTQAGKTTLMRLMAGLDKPTSGRILVDGKDATGVPVRERSVAMVYQQFMNYPSLSVYENIASPLRVAKLKSDEIDRRVLKVARLLGLESMLDRLPHQLSGGQQQRTAIARAIVKDADLVLLDEPLANLDYKLREELREELPSILQQAGAILVYATAEPLEALLLGGITATLSEGRVIQCGPTPQVYHRPNHIELGPRLFRSATQRSDGHQAGRLGPARRRYHCAGRRRRGQGGGWNLHAGLPRRHGPPGGALARLRQPSRPDRAGRDQRFRKLRPCRDGTRHLRVRGARREHATAGSVGDVAHRRGAHFFI